MREILFRGKRKHDQRWVYGSYLHLKMGRDYICDGAVWIGTMTPCKEEVFLETVGQFTGFTDKNGKKIFEGDILKSATIFKVDFIDGTFALRFDGDALEYVHEHFLDEMEVIGNIHDNPELLEVSDAK